jgi:ATP/ADP translocase/CRP-like cAMP-binding protein/HEAT repeat protein
MTASPGFQRVSRLVGRVVSLQQGDGAVALLMFAYSFLAMASYNILKPLTRSKFISDLGSDNLPYVLLASAVVIGLLMHWYTTAAGRLARRHVIPATQAAIIVLLVVFSLLLRTGADWVTVAFYLFGQILGLLLISQFWTLANDVYDARQAKRLFGFIGAGASLGGGAGAAIVATLVDRVGTPDLLLVSAVTLGGCMAIVVTIGRRHPISTAPQVEDEAGIGGREAIRLLLQSRHFRVVALSVACAAAGATIVEQQLNMAAEALKGHEGDAAIAAYLAQIIVYTSIVGFILQVVGTSLIHRSLGLAFALVLLPVALGSMAMLILATGAFWAPQAARVLDSTLRYTVDKTSREVLFLPLPSELKYRAKPFIDVTMDRFAKGATAVVILVLIQPWGLGLDWRRLSYASIGVMVLWIATALAARRQYLNAFRQSLGSRTLEVDSVRIDVGDPATIEALVEELSNPDPTAVLYAIGMLEMLDKRRLISPLLLHHESPRVRARVLRSLSAVRSHIALRWRPAVERLVHDPDVGVRAAALRALAELSHEDAASLLRRHLGDPEPQVAVTAAMMLAQSGLPGDVDTAERTFQRLISDSREAGAIGRREAAVALAYISAPRFRPLLVPLIYDHDTRVVAAAINSARRVGASDGLFLPALISLLGHRVLKAAAREALVGYGEAAVGTLAHALADPREDLWIRRHVPATLALIPTQASMDALIGALEDHDRFLSFKSITAIEKLHRAHRSLNFPVAAIERRVLHEALRYYEDLCARHDLLREPSTQGTLLVRALDERLERAIDCLYRLLGLLYNTEHVAAARYTIEQGDARRRAAAVEYLDNLLKGVVRKRVLPILEETSDAGKLRHAYQALQTRPRELEDTLARLLHDDDPVFATAAVHFIVQRRLWALTGDIEYVLGHQSADGHPAVEAASWALRIRRAGRPSTEPLTIVELAHRVRMIPLFEFVSVDELFRVAAAGEEARHPAGRELFHPGAAPDHMEFLIEGAVRMIQPSGTTSEIAAPAVLGLEDVLQGAPPAVTIRAVEPVVCFRIGAGEFMTMVSGNALLAQSLFEMLLARATWQDAKPPLLTRATPPQLRALIEVAAEVPMTEGTVLVEQGDAPAVFQVVDGEVRLETAGGASVVLPGMTLGVADTLSGGAASARAVVTRSGRVLRVNRDDLFAVLTDHVDLMQGVFSEVLALPRKELPGIAAQA